MMHPDALSRFQQACAIAVAEPELAFALLVHALANDTVWRQACTKVYGRDNAAYETAQERAHGALTAGTSPSLDADHALALVAALDGWLHDQRAGNDGVGPLDEVRQGEEAWWVVGRPSPLRSRRGSQPDFLPNWHPHHVVVPRRLAGLQILITRDEHARVRLSGSVSVCAAGLPDEVQPVRLSERRGWTSDSVSNGEERLACASAVALAASEDGADVLVLPELTLPEAQRSELLDALDDAGRRPRLLLPGTYHERFASDFRNIARLYDDELRPVLTQHKLKRMHNGDDHEDIETGDTLTLLQTQAGLVGVGICLDFADDEMSQLWRAVQPSLVLVPTMSNDATMRAHQHQARGLAAFCTWVVVANQPPPGGPPHLCGGAICGPGDIRSCVGEHDADTRISHVVTLNDLQLRLGGSRRTL